jgi:hypothetical protein
MSKNELKIVGPRGGVAPGFLMKESLARKRITTLILIKFRKKKFITFAIQLLDLR